MIPCRRRPARPSRSTAGFTLIELVIALVISGIVASVVFDVILGQNRFARYQGAREEVQQNARVALELIASELRSLPPDVILTAETNRIRFALPRAWGVLCTPVTPATTAVWVRFPTGVFPTTEFSTSNSWGLAVGHPEPNVARGDPPEPDNVEDIPEVWSRVYSVTQPAVGNTCDAALGAPVAGSPVFERSFGGSDFFDGARRVPENTIPVGTPVFAFQIVEYDVSTSNVPGLWIRRNTLPNAQPVAGPVPDDAGANAGLQFTYFDAEGSNPASMAEIARIGLRVRTNSSARINDKRQLETAFTEVYLRNRN